MQAVSRDNLSVVAIAVIYTKETVDAKILVSATKVQPMSEVGYNHSLGLVMEW